MHSSILSSPNSNTYLNPSTINSISSPPSAPDINSYHAFNRNRTPTFPHHQQHQQQQQQQQHSLNRTSLSTRKSRQLPCFNVLLLGAKSTGKTRFLETLIGTLIPSLPNQIILDHSQHKHTKPTQTLSSNTFNLSNLSGEKIALNLIDTAGLDIRSADELRVDLQMNEILRFIEDKFEESLQVERQVHRNPSRLGESHVHVSVYFIDPSTIVNRSFSIGSLDHNHDVSNHHQLHQDEHLSAIDLRQLKRLSRRSNILPVISRSDELTESRLAQLKQIVRSDLKAYGIQLGVFDSKDDDDSEETSTSQDESEPSDNNNQTHQGNTSPAGSTKKPIRRKSVTMSPIVRRRRSSLMNYLKDELDSVNNLVPLSVIGADHLPLQGLDGNDLDRLNQSNPFSHLSINNHAQTSQLDAHGNLQKESIYVRKFKWATVDVLNPNHCEFALARAVLLGSHLTKLKESTRLEKYESYRTEKLISRRITINQGTKGLEEQRQIALELEKIEIPHLNTPKSIFGIQSESHQGLQQQTQHYHQPRHQLPPIPTSTHENSSRKSKSNNTNSFIGSRMIKRPNQSNSSAQHPPPPASTLPYINQETAYSSQSHHSHYQDSSLSRPMVF